MNYVYLCAAKSRDCAVPSCPKRGGISPSAQPKHTRWFKYDRDKLWLVYTQLDPVIFKPPCTIVKAQSCDKAAECHCQWTPVEDTHSIHLPTHLLLTMKRTGLVFEKYYFQKLFVTPQKCHDIHSNAFRRTGTALSQNVTERHPDAPVLHNVQFHKTNTYRELD
jgi:hypothetical protein